MPSIKSAPRVEHYVTLFDNNFLPVGLCLYRSLLEHGGAFHLWVLCIDEVVEQHLRQLALAHVTLIPLREAENERLLAIKPGRNRGEYCWTLTPFTPQFVFDRDATVERVTYLDADLYFFDDPGLLLNEFDLSAKHVLITEHAYDPKYDTTRRSGRFCVQFISFRRTPEARKVLNWWQDRCLEWCFDRVEAGKFGDQKYLDQWPSLFGPEIHILEQKEKALGPWNVSWFAQRSGGALTPVFYHFHGLRLLSPARLLLYSGYQVGKSAQRLYEIYVDNLVLSMHQLQACGIDVPCLPLSRAWIKRLLRLKRRILVGEAYMALPVAQPIVSAH